MMLDKPRSRINTKTAKALPATSSNVETIPAAKLVKPSDQDLGQPFGQNDRRAGHGNGKMSCFGFSLRAMIRRPTAMCQ